MERAAYDLVLRVGGRQSTLLDVVLGEPLIPVVGEMVPRSSRFSKL